MRASSCSDGERILPGRAGDLVRGLRFVQLRLAQVEESFKTKIESLIYYVTHATGVILRGYDYEFFKEDEKSIAKARLQKEENGFVSLYAQQERASIVGVNQCEASKVKESDTVLILEASYIAPESVSRSMMEQKVPSDYVFYRSSRGSEPELHIGMQYLLRLLKDVAEAEVFGGDIELNDNYDEEIVSIKKEEMDTIIGTSIDKMRVSNILKKLGFKHFVFWLIFIDFYNDANVGVLTNGA